MSEVEVDLYSGRPNPRFRLDAAAAAELERRLAALPPLATAAAARDGLGYRGLRVTGGAGFAELLISAGLVELRGRDGSLQRRADPGRALERWLIETGATQLPPGELALLRGELGG